MTKKAPNTVDLHVGRRVRVRRVLCGLSQTQLADQLGLTFQQLQKYESGANRISASKLWLLSQLLDVPVQWFFDGLEDPAGAGDDMPTRREQLELARSLALLTPAVKSHFIKAIHAVAAAHPPAAAAE